MHAGRSLHPHLHLCALHWLFLSSLNTHISLSQSSLHSMISLSVLKNVVYPSALVVVLDVKCVPQAPVFKLMVPSG